MIIQEEEFISNVGHYLEVAEKEHILIIMKNGTNAILRPLSEREKLKNREVSLPKN